MKVRRPKILRLRGLPPTLMVAGEVGNTETARCVSIRLRGILDVFNKINQLLLGIQASHKGITYEKD